MYDLSQKHRCSYQTGLQCSNSEHFVEILSKKRVDKIERHEIAQNRNIDGNYASCSKNFAIRNL